MSSKFLRKKNFACRLRVLQLFAFLGGLTMLTTSSLVTHAQYSNVPVTGFNADIVADGLGSIPSASTTTDVDGATGASFVFVSPTYGPAATVCVPGATAWPSTNQITSTNTTTGTGITYQLQSPGNGTATNNNSLKLANGTSGTLNLVTPISASNLYFVCLGGNGAVAFTATVTYTDATTETITPTVSAPDWCGGAAAYKLTTQTYYRISRTATTCGGATCQYIYEVPAAISVANYGKTITSVTVNNTNTTGTTFLHILALGMKPPCAVPTVAPTALNFTDSTSSTVTGSFTIGNAANYLVVRYPIGSTPTNPSNGVTYTVGGALGTGTIASIGTTNTFTASGLLPATGYTFYVYGYNSGTTCGGPVYNTTSTSGTQWTKSCATLVAGTISSTATSVCPATTFTLSLNAATTGPAITYQWQSAPTGTGSFTNLTSGTASTYAGTQAAASDYRCILTCSGGNTAATPVFTIAQNAPGACYCIPTSTTATTYYITSFSTTGGTTNITNNSTGSGQYNDYYATISASAVQGNAVNFSWTGNSVTSQKRSIYIDWNQDGDFVDAGENVYNGTAVTTTDVTGSFAVPFTALTGTTRMRIRSTQNSNTMAPCGLLSTGETEDYAFTVILATGCVIPANLVAASVASTTATVNFSAPPQGNTPTNYIYELRTDGTAAGSGATGLAQSGTVITSPISFTGLGPVTNYVLFARTYCSVGDTSGWTSVSFATTFDPLTPVPLTGFNADVIANGVGAATTSTNNDVDGAGYGLLSNDYRTTSASTAPSNSLPVSRTIVNGLKKYLLAPYYSNNSLRMSGVSTGMIRFLAPKKAYRVYVMGVSGSGLSTNTTTVYFRDGTTQVVTQAFPDWYTSGNNAANAVGRIKYSNNVIEAGPYLHDSAIVISPVNRDKQIDSIGFSHTGTVMNVLAVSVIPNPNQACKLPLAIDSVYNLTSGAASLAWRGNGTNTNYQISVVAQGGYADAGTITTATGAGVNISALSSLASATNYQVYVRSNCGGSSYSDWIGPIDFTTLSNNCTGAPAAGTLTSTATSVCTNVAYNLSVANVSTNNGITLKWQSSPTGQNTWTTLSTITPVLGTSTYNYNVVSQTAATDYRSVIVCSFSNDSAVSNVVTVAQNAPNTCYCPNSYTSNATGYITNFTTTGGITNLSSTSTNQTGGYQDFTSQVVSGVAPTSISFSSTAAGTNHMAIYVDWNQDGDFTDAGENVYTQNATYASSFSGSFSIPPTATPGNTRMRVRLLWSGTIADACTTYTTGETEDYTFNVIAQTACTGVPAPGNTVASTSSLCVSGTSNLSVDNNYVNFSGIAYQWQSSDNGTVWNNVSGATTSTFTTPVLTQSTSYRLRVICVAGPDTAYSTAKTISVNPLPTVLVNPTQGAFCTTGAATLTANGASTYAWSPATNLSATTGATVNASPTSVTTYTVTGTDVNGCVNSATTTVGPITSITPMATSLDACAPNTAASITVTPIAAATGTMEYELTDTLGVVVSTWQSGTVFNVIPTTAGVHKYFVFARLASCNTIVSDTGSVSLYAGFGATVVSNNATCPNGDGSLVVTNPAGPGLENIQTWYNNDFSSATLNATQASLSGNASITGGKGVITPSATGNKGGLTILNPSGITTNALNVTFDMTADNIINTFGTGGADGIAYSFGDDATYSTSISNGAGSKLRVVFDAAGNSSENNNHAGVYITYGYAANTQMGDASTGVLAQNSNTDWKVTTDKPVSIVITDAGKLTLKWNGIVFFSDVQLPPAYMAANKSTWKHLFTAFTGGDAMRFAIDNLNIKYGTETFNYGSAPANSNTVPSTWQTSNTFSGLSGGDSLDIWIANPSNTASCHQKLGTFGVSSPMMTSLLASDNPTCIGAEDGYAMLKVPTAGTYSVSYNKNGGGTITQTALTSGNDGTNEYVVPLLGQGAYTNIKVINATSCVSNNVAGPLTLVAPTVDSVATTSATSAPTTQPGAGTQYYTNNNCALIAAITSPNNLGQVTAALTVNGTAGTSTSGEPFLGRSYAITPSQNATLAANLKLYFTAADFAAYNASTSVGTTSYPAILANGSNLRIRAFHGLPGAGTTGPNGSYDATNSDILQPSSIVWNATGGFWVVDVYSPNGFSGFFANTSINTPLNITLGTLTAHNEGAVNVVNWDTKTEAASDKFIIERSSDARAFSSIGTQLAKGNAPSEYTFVDNKPFSGINYYRLVLMNEEGTKEYTKVVSAEVKNGNRFQFNVFPNPATSEVTVSLSDVIGQGFVELTDLTGRTIISKNVSGNQSITLSLNGLSNGMYIVKFHDDAHLESIKISKGR